MGAEFQYQKVIASNHNELKERYTGLVSQHQYTHGHGGYTGTFAESPGLTILDKEFVDEESAVDYVFDNAQKWENSLAVKIRNSDKWIVGGCFSS